jgi:hypothetical protein
MRSVRPSRRITLACFLAVVTIVPAIASDNSESSLEVFDLLDSDPISDSPPPPIILRTKPPSLQMLQAQLASDQELVYNQQLSLDQAVQQLNFWLAQPKDPSGLEDPNVPQWQQAVASTQNLVDTVQAQINSLTAQIAAAQ